MLQFKNIILHNFSSYHHAEVDLQGRGFCLVSGQNKYKKDNALSNGSGKSFLWSAICFAITGETINGLKTGLKNLNVDENSCYVTLDFKYDGVNYVISRTVAPKSDLKIIKNDVDVSGKGIRDSERKLGEYLPDLTKDLIASTIIIGQGMPNKFSSFSPSGRKELLEKLTKSDFMIEDTKNRVAARQNELNSKLREYEDSLLANKTQLSMIQTALNVKQAEYDRATAPDFDTEIVKAQTTLDGLQAQLTETNKKIQNYELEAEQINTKLLKLTDEKSSVSKEELENYLKAFNQINTEKTQTSMTITAIKKEIAKLKAIKDVCPTCGQKIPNVSRPDTSTQETNLGIAEQQLINIDTRLKDCTTKHNSYTASINDFYDNDISNLKITLSSNKSEAQKLKNTVGATEQAISTEQNKLAKLKYDKQNWNSYYTKLETDITSYNKDIANLTSLLTITETGKQEILDHLAVIKKMDTLIKRDFRGYLLTNIITYINKKAKDYCEIVFETRDLEIYLDGNALDISYCGKMFDNLSGGEKQRVDLILQFAIRDMLNSYLGSSANILVLDEITDFLDKQSCGAIMKLLTQELNTTESVFIISHHAEELELPIDSEIKVIKNEYGISEVI